VSAQTDEEWYWDLRRGVAVPASERGPGEQMLGPYPSRHDAEHWKARVEARNDAWDDGDRDDEARDGAEPDPPESPSD
jgi:hypothetical protein